MNGKILATLAGFTVASSLIATGIKNHPKLTLLGFLTLSPIAVLVGNEVGQGTVEELLRGKEKELASTRSELRDSKSTISELEKVLVIEAQLKQENQTLETENQTLKTEVGQVKQALSVLQQLVQNKEAENSQLTQQVTQLNDQLSEWMDNFDESVATEGEKLFQQFKSKMLGEIKERFKATAADHQDLLDQAVALKNKACQGMYMFEQVNREQRDYFMKVFDQYEAVNSASVDEKSELLVQIEALKQKCIRLELKLSGVLPEPEYLPPGFSVHRELANSYAKLVWDNLKIPLAVKGSQQRSNGLIEMAYGYSSGTNSQQLTELLNRQSGDFAKQLHIHRIISTKEHDLTPSIIVGLRREPAIKEDDLKRLLTPIDKLATQVIREMSRKGTVRIMGATGDGKGVCARYLLSRIVTTLNWYIRLHDPQHGSDQDHWDIPKVSKSGTELKQALKKITNQMKDREVTKIHSPVTLDILDEIDTQLEKEDKGQFLDLISRIRHLGMKLILIGQNPKVSRAGLQWSDMAQMIAFYQGSSALDAIKNNPSLELKKDILLKQYNEISTVFEAKNEWLDDHKKHYFGLCVIPGKNPQWYELPVADEIEIARDLPIIGESFEVTVSNSQFVEGQNSAKVTPDTLAEDGQAPKIAKAETHTQQRLALNSAKPSVISHVGGSAKSRHTVKTICKKHPDVELRQRKDGRYYCPGCKKKLRKDELAVEV